jgi:hypothetical protein
MGLSYLEGYINSNTVNGIECKVVNEIYCNGKVVRGVITPETLEGDTYLISATMIDGSFIELKQYEVTKNFTGLHLKPVDLNKLYPIQELRNSVCEKYKTCRTAPYDFVISLITHVGGLVKSLVSCVITKLKNSSNVKHKDITEQEVQDVAAEKNTYIYSKSGYIEYNSVNGIHSTVVYRFYHNGKKVATINSNTLEDDTYLIKASSINGDILKFAVYEVSVGEESFKIEEFDYHEKYIPSDLLVAIGDAYDICRKPRTDLDNYYDFISD